MIRGYLYHLQLTLRLNFASKQAIIYGYLVPILFLVAFGAVFRSGSPPLLHQMGQLVTISALGGACFGLPTALVAERERGLWKRYRLLPKAGPALIASTLTARFFLIATAALMQIVLARWIYKTPFPVHPGQFALGYCFVAFAFLGLGLLVAALAGDVPAVQALGQCLFLPLIMIGGVGVPLIVLPSWAQRFAGFFPGRYSVDVLQAGVSGDPGSLPLAFNLGALAAMGAAAGFVGAKLFRWDPGHRPSRGSRTWVALALVPWIAAGTGALATGHWQAVAPADDTAGQMSETEINSIAFDGLPPDGGTVAPIADSIEDVDPDQKARLDQIIATLDTWAPAHTSDTTQAIRNILCVASIPDLNEDPLEGQIGRVVVRYLFAHFSREQLTQSLAWIIFHPDEGTIPDGLPEFGIPDELDPGIIRGRSVIYALKVLGRVRGQFPT